MNQISKLSFVFWISNTKFLRIWKQTFVPLHFLRLMLSNSFLYLKIFFGTEKFPFFEWLVFWEQNWIFLMNNTIYFNFFVYMNPISKLFFQYIFFLAYDPSKLFYFKKKEGNVNFHIFIFDAIRNFVFFLSCKY